jgi:carboxymethylenebutenolidase
MQQHSIAHAGFVETGPGTRAYYARPAGDGPFPGALVFQEAFGVNGYVRREAERLAAHGYAAIAPDIFDGQTFAYEDREGIAPRLQALTDEAMLQRIEPAMRFLAEQAEVKKGPYGAVGFCMGGRLAVLVAAEYGSRIGAASSFYGGGMAPEEQRFFTPLLDRLPSIEAELLLLYGAEDASILAAEHGRIAAALSEHKKAYTLTVYPHAGHAFASRDRKELYREDSAEDAWRRTLELFGRVLT